MFNNRLPNYILLQVGTLYIPLLLLLCSTAHAQLRNYSNEFLSIGVDARAFAMGSAYTATTNDVYSAYWNPAGLTRIGDRWQGAAMHAEYFQSIAKYDFAGVAIPLENRNTLAIAAYRFGVDNILNTTELIDNQGNIDYDRLSTFSAADYAVTMSYAGNFFNIPQLDFGITAKLIYRNVGKFANSFGFGMDAGMQYKSRDFTLGVMARDITTTFNVWSVNQDALNTLEVDGVLLNEAPEETIELTKPKLNIGATQKIYLSERFTATGAMDLQFQFAQTNDLISTEFLSFSPAAGVEVGFDDMIFVRAGVNNFQQIPNFDGAVKVNFQPNAGVGFKYHGVSVDYALTNIGGQGIALYSNIFSVKIDMAEFY
ncbi:MAG: PorV/PorQ family protein [Weeksellaceae bacterium]|nr:PorV/PorQ family protein [Weeksellaceae bacterium]